MMVYGGSWGGRAFGLLWLLGGLLFLVLVVVLVVLAIRHLTRMNPPSHGPWSAPLLRLRLRLMLARAAQLRRQLYGVSDGNMTHPAELG
jgi:hypothetical protein